MLSSKVNMHRLVLAAVCCVVTATAQAATTYFKLADEWGTIQPAGPRAGTSGIRFLNAEGSNNAAFASTATLRFYTQDIVDQANAQYGVGGWQVSNVNLVLSQSNSGFTSAGGLKLYWFANDNLPITNGEDDASSAAPGLFSSLGVSQLRYQSGANPVDTTLADGTTDASAIFGSVAQVDSYQFTSTGSGGDWPLDVLAPQANGVHALINPEDGNILPGAPTYGISPPIVNPAKSFRSDTQANFDADSQRVMSNLDIAPIAADLGAGAGALSFILVPDAATAATYKGNAFSGDYPARIYIEVSPLSNPAQPGDLDGDGDVDGADFANWEATFPKQSGATLAQGDADGDGDVDGADFVLWQTHFPSGSGSATSPVPEPPAALLAVLGLTTAAVIALRRSNVLHKR